MDLTAAPSPPPDPWDELDAALSDALRRASSRAEHIRLVRIRSMVIALNGGLAS
jgi:hypothetical protein